MASFSVAHGLTKINEGGYQCLENDNGNWTGGQKGVGKLIGTKYGISAPVLSEYLGREATVEDMKYLKPEIAGKIYDSRYWKKMRGDEIKDQRIANQIYDMAVNAGVKPAVKLMQRELGIGETGIMDDATLKAINGETV